VTGWQGGINVAAPTKTVTLSGALPAGFPTATTSPNQQIFATTARRAIVEKARCESCHASLGNFTSKTFHGGQFNDPTTCAVCHDPNLFDSGWQIASGAWVHEIHSSAKRAADVPKGGALFNIGVGPTWATLEYPGLLRDCLQCHLPGTVNFGNAANATQVGFMTYRTALSGAYTVGPYTAPFGNITSKDYGARFAYNPATGATTDAAGTTLVNSPITNACFSCHTGTVAQNHMLQNGGVLYATRASVTVNGKAVPTEGCLACHAAGRVADAEAVHLQTMQ
jgi:OmcA/MtrC family decaheme c-type cytochrome